MFSEENARIVCLRGSDCLLLGCVANQVHFREVIIVLIFPQ